MWFAEFSCIVLRRLFPLKHSRQFRNIKWIWDRHFSHFLKIKRRRRLHKTGSGLSDAVFASPTLFSGNGLYNMHVLQFLYEFWYITMCILIYFTFNSIYFAHFVVLAIVPPKNSRNFIQKCLALIQFNRISYMHCYLRRSVILKVSSWNRNEILPSFCNFR